MQEGSQEEQNIMLTNSLYKKKRVVFTYFSSVETLSIYGYLVAYVDSLAKEARVGIIIM